MTYHFIITMVFNDAQINWDGIYEAKPGETRSTLYNAISSTTRERNRIPAGRGVVLFFSLEPNELPGGAR